MGYGSGSRFCGVSGGVFGGRGVDGRIPVQKLGYLRFAGKGWLGESLVVKPRFCLYPGISG